MKRKRNDREGIALLYALFSMIMILGALTLVGTSLVRSDKNTRFAVDDLMVSEAAKSGVELAVNKLWAAYVVSSGNTTGNVASYQSYLTNTVQIPINEDLNRNGTMDHGEDLNGNGQFNIPPASNDARGINILASAQVFKDDVTNATLATLESVWVSRYDTPWESMLTVRAVANANGRMRTAVQVIRVGGQPLDHSKFAVMANNINCILCHLEINNIDLVNNGTNAANYGTFDRVKVAALQSLMVRTGSADSKMAGTLYTRGKVYSETGSLLSASQIASANFKSYAFSNTNGKITQNAGTGAKTSASFANAGLDATGKVLPFANLYMNYSTDPAYQTDGDVPVNFPSPFPDTNTNRVVDTTEFNTIVSAANGSLSFQYGSPSGSISNGVAYGVPTGSTYTGNSLPTTSNSALSQLQTTGAYNGTGSGGNLILVGTAQDPIIINNTVAVNGDLVIAGKVKGNGRLLVKGNTYVVGDTTYADDPGYFGKYDVNASNPNLYSENALAIVSGGSIYMGDYLTVRGVNGPSSNNSQYPDSAHYSIDTRTKNVTANYDNTNLPYGYFDQWSVDRNTKTKPAGQPGDQLSFTSAELMLFNTQEVQRAVADANYIPRFYGLRSSQPNNIYVYDSTNEHTVQWDESGVKLVTDYLTQKSYPANIWTKGAKHYSNPASNWLSETSLRNFWYNDEMTRPSSNRAFQFDGLLYSNNAIFALTRSKVRHKSNTEGIMKIRGGIVAADLGMLVAGPDSTSVDSLQLLYDPRVERFLMQSDTTKPEFARASFYFVNGNGLG